LGSLVDGPEDGPFRQHERHKFTELVALDPTLQGHQAFRHAGAGGFCDDGVACGDLLLQLLQLVRPPPFLTHAHGLVAAHDQALAVVFHLTQVRIAQIRLQHALLEQGADLGVGVLVQYNFYITN
jgi:hypothetical protein